MTETERLEATGKFIGCILVVVVLLGLLAMVGWLFSPEMQAWRGETATLQGCMRAAQKTVGRSIRELTKDRPDYVAGYLGPGTDSRFTCTRKETGTRGTVWEVFVEAPAPEEEGAATAKELREMAESLEREGLHDIAKGFREAAAEREQKRTQ